MSRAPVSGPAVLVAALCAWAASSAHATTAPTSARELHTAQCVAVLDMNSRQLAAQVKSGQDTLKPLLLERLKSGAAFIGTAYLAGERDEARSVELLETALEAQKSLPEQELAARLADCQGAGAKLLAQANALERAVINRAAARRLQRLLAQ